MKATARNAGLTTSKRLSAFHRATKPRERGAGAWTATDPSVPMLDAAERRGVAGEIVAHPVLGTKLGLYARGGHRTAGVRRTSA